MQHVTVEREIGGRTVRIETGKIARLATGAVMISYDDTVVMTSAMRTDPRPGLDFFPLQCDYREKTSAAGTFPGGFRKREGAPNEKEILTMRLMDRPIRPLFPDGFIDEVQIQAWVMSHDGQNDSDIWACNGASAALWLTDAPFEGPIATARVGRILTEDDEMTLVLNPTQAQLEYSDLDLVVSGHDDGINMIEVGAAEVQEDVMTEAIRFGYEEAVKPMLEMIKELAEKFNAPAKRMGELTVPPDDVVGLVKSHAEADMTELRKIKSKQERNNSIDALRERVLNEVFPIPEGVAYSEHLAAEQRRKHAKQAFRSLEKKTAHRLIAEEGIRADGRDKDEIRSLLIEAGIFPRTHGSALFERGETQSIVTCTLGTVKNEQIVDGLLPEYAKKFYLHYNFPPFCTGETGRIAGPGRREIGHGALAERSLMAIIPDNEDFPYTIRLISEITMSNGSSSMASVCGGCLALMDAGVPILNTCAGISVGRFTAENGTITHVTDIIGEEDFFGEMDFKVSGTRDGITGIQLDLKARGLFVDEIETIFEQAKKGRLELIDAMEKVIGEPREGISKWAPRIMTLQIDPEKIGKLIGPGGKTIRGIQERTGANIDVEEDGTVFISAVDGEAGEQAKAEVEALAAEIKVGTVYDGKVVSVKDFGAFIELVPGTDGMCHISELADQYVKAVEDVVKVGDEIKVKVINIDENGRIKLSRKALLKNDGESDNNGGSGGGGDAKRGGKGRNRKRERQPAKN